MIKEIFEKNELKTLGKFYLATILGNIEFYFPFYIIYFLGIGFTFFEIALMVGCSQIAQAIFEIPTGAFSDQYSRKYSTIIGYTLSAMAFFAIPFFKTFTASIIIWIIIGISKTFISGSLDSWVVDNIPSKNKKEIQKKYFYKNEILRGLGMSGGWFLSGLIVKQFNMEIVFQLTGGMLLITGIYLTTIKEKLQTAKKSIRNAIKQNIETTKTGFQHIKNNKKLKLIFIATIIGTGGFIGLDGWHPAMIDIGVKLQTLGYLMSAYGIVRIIIPMIAYKIKNIETKIPYILMIEVILTASIALFSAKLIWFAIIIYLMIDAPRRLIAPAINNIKHKLITSKVRATIISIENMGFTAGLIIFQLIGGKLMDHIHIPYIMATGAIFILIKTLIYFKIFRNGKQQKIKD